MRKLGEVCEINPRRTTTRCPNDAATCFIPMTAVDDQTGGIKDIAMRPFAEVAKGYTFFQSGDVIFAKITPCMQNGKHAVVPDLPGGFGFGSTEFHVLRPSAAVLPQWVHYFIRQPAYLKLAEACLQGAVGQQRVPASFLAGTDLPVPDLPTQRRIATRLKAQMAAVDQARQAAQQQAAALALLPSRYLRLAFESEEAQQWPRMKVAEALDFLPARSINLKGKAAIRAVTTACLTETGFNPAGVKDALMMEDGAADAIIEPGEILIARSNTPVLVGRAAHFRGCAETLVASDLTIRLRCQDQLVPAFAGAWFSYLFVSGYWRERASGASDTMKKIGRAQLAGTDVPVPSLEIQRQIAARLDETFRLIQLLQSALSTQRAALEALPGAFLREAFGSLTTD